MKLYELKITVEEDSEEISEEQLDKMAEEIEQIADMIVRDTAYRYKVKAHWTS